MRIAIASSGLGHIARGVETWALDSAVALSKLSVNSNQLSVTLFAGATLSPGRGAVSSGLSISVLDCLKRGDQTTRQLTTVSPSWTWRWGLKSEYGWEQLSFWWKLWPILRREHFDILHVQDPILAFWCRRFRRMGLLKTREILAHGTEESPEFLGQFDYVQHLAPWHLREARKALSRELSVVGCQLSGSEGREGICDKQITGKVPSVERPFWFVIPNFVDTEVFKPSQVSGFRFQVSVEARKRYGIPENAFVIGSVAAVKKHHKRIDYLIREFAAYQGICVHPPASGSGVTSLRLSSLCSEAMADKSVACPELVERVPFLLIVGSKCDDSDELVALAERLAPGRVKILLDMSRADMPDLFRSMNVFVHSALFEMMPIAFLEAMSSGLPIICHNHPVMRWIIGAKSAIKDETGNLRPERGWEAGREAATSIPEESSSRLHCEAKGGLTGQLSVISEQLSVKGEQEVVGNLLNSPLSSAGYPSGLRFHPSSFSGGACIDMSKEGALAEFLAQVTPEWITKHGAQARQRAEKMFSKDVVVQQMIRIYEEVVHRGK